MKTIPDYTVSGGTSTMNNIILFQHQNV